MPNKYEQFSSNENLYSNQLQYSNNLSGEDIKNLHNGQHIMTDMFREYDKICKKKRFIEEFSLSDAIYIGFWQSFAIIPGASRSGCCITGALIRGFRNFDAAHLSLIMSIPTILGSSVLLVLELFTPSSTDFFAQNLIDVIYCVVFSYFAAFVSIKVFFRFIQKISFLPFVIYRILFGSFIIIFLGLI